MSQSVNNILALIAALSPIEKAELMGKLSGGKHTDRSHPIRESFGRAQGSINTINFAPRTGGRCPVCGK
ncbi:hypothetical protein [Aeromonas hydrophila]|uniref:hypothetical protein n=1 Tax=Aeromonas hydrophila TaxID=644 RepID=UPI00114C9113|nr:hypothetical protein [Aeromonas hydrophila]